MGRAGSSDRQPARGHVRAIIVRRGGTQAGVEERRHSCVAVGRSGAEELQLCASQCLKKPVRLPRPQAA